MNATGIAAATLLDPKAAYVVIIDTFSVEPERADELVAFLVEKGHSIFRHIPGFVSANFHVALDRTQVVNYAQWESLQALEALQNNAQVAGLMQELLQIAKGFVPVPYELRASIPAAC